MRRTASVILFILGGWMLSTEVFMAALDLREGLGTTFGAIGLIGAMAAAPLLLGMWASPGNRLAELGLVLMIGAGVGASIILMLVMVTNDPGFAKAMPPNQPLPDFHFNFVLGALNLLLVAGGGYLLRRWALDRAQHEPVLQQVFD